MSVEMCSIFGRSMVPPAHIGKMNSLEIIRATQAALFLDAGDLGTLILPRYDTPRGSKVGDSIDVFILTDAEGRIAATTRKPKAMVGDFAALKVVSVTDFGAFLDWGIGVDLLAPARELVGVMEVGKSYVVHLFLDRRNSKITASCRLELFLGKSQPNYRIGQKVALIVYEETKLGFKAVIDQTHWGMLYRTEVFRELEIGDETEGYIKKLREDGKIDLRLEGLGNERIDAAVQKVLTALKRHNGTLYITDTSSPQAISKELGISKKTYKKAVGHLYKERSIKIEHDFIRLVDRGHSSAK